VERSDWSDGDEVEKAVAKRGMVALRRISLTIILVEGVNNISVTDDKN